MKKRIISFALILILSIGFLSSISIANAVTIGTTGKCRWTLNGTVLTIFGNGNMGKYLDGSGAPWGTDITEVIIENGVTTIGDMAFAFCKNLTRITLPDSVKTIGYYAFYECVNLEYLDLGNGVRHIFGGAFEECSALTSVVIPDSTIMIDAMAFCACSNLSSVTIGKNVSSIGAYAFDLCESLTSVVIPDSVLQIGEAAFSNCKNLESVTIGKNVTKIDNLTFSCCRKLKSFIIPESIEKIGYHVFFCCDNFVKTAIPSKMTTIASNSFVGCALTVVYIPKEVTLIEDSAFSHTDIEYVYYGGSEYDREKLTVLAGNDKLNNATWIYNASGLPDHEYDDDYDAVCNICGTERIALNAFTDIKKNAWYKQYVDYCVAYSIFTGTTKNTFSPNSNITRAQFVQVLANISGVDTSNRNVKTEFSDVPAKKWFTPAVKWASENGVVNGMGGGKFQPNANVTREQMCVMLVNFANFGDITLKAIESKENFADDGKISKWAKTAVYTCQMADIVNGKGKGTFDPKGTGTRAEACVMFTKFHKDYMTTQVKK